MKNKGFTLIELLAVIVILAIIALIATPIILNIISDAREESNERSVELYANAIKNAVARHYLNSNDSAVGDYTQSNEGKTLTGPVTLKVDYDGKVECGTIKIDEDGKVSLAGCTVNGSTKEYTYGDPEEVEVAVTPICTAVTEENVTSIITSPENTIKNIPARDSSGNLLYNVGDEFVCNVGSGLEHHFFILGENSDGTINLIMDSNVTSIGGKATTDSSSDTTNYADKGDYTTAGGKLSTEETCVDGGFACTSTDYGPITALEYLNSAVSRWTNVPSLSKTYTSSDGTRTFTINGVARLPEYGELYNLCGVENNLCSGDSAWLALNTNNNYYSVPKAENIRGYWLMFETLEKFGYGYAPTFGSGATSEIGSFYADTEKIGVRPVITVQKGHLQ